MKRFLGAIVMGVHIVQSNYTIYFNISYNILKYLSIYTLSAEVYSDKLRKYFYALILSISISE
jgi:hypothetical protein